MAETRKVLGQSKPGAATLTDAYAVPAATQAVVSSVVVANQSNVTTTLIRISVAVAGAADATKQYVAYDVSIKPGETKEFTIGMTLGAADVVRVYNLNALCSFNIFGVEIA